MPVISRDRGKAFVFPVQLNMKLKLYLKVTDYWSQGSNSCKWTGLHGQKMSTKDPFYSLQAQY